MNPLHDDLIRTYQEDRLRAARTAHRPRRPRRRSPAPVLGRLSFRSTRIRPEETL